MKEKSFRSAVFSTVNVSKNVPPFSDIEQIKLITLHYDVAAISEFTEAQLSQK
jgi:hypothetical protein